jgi:beta-galactosidase/beta-glucuronidase
MNKIYLTLVAAICLLQVNAQWQPAGNRIKTQWANAIDAGNPLPEYPRPMRVRNQWKNLNGLWEYAIAKKGSPEPASFDGKILVPFAVESSLSGVQKAVGTDNELWYKRSFTLASAWKGKYILLHFGAVDWRAELWINDIKVGMHEGGYTPFSFDITPFLNATGEQKLVLKVWDPTDAGYQPRGKQVNNPNGIWYTAVTGIWQTVWMEAVEERHISALRSVPDIDRSIVSVQPVLNATTYGDIVDVTVKDGQTVVNKAKASAGQAIDLAVPSAKLWSPELPFLYNLEVALYSKGKMVDRVESYFAMRKISTKRDENGIVRMQLNNKDYFQYGPLDQGWWPDGLYTAPTDEAL